MFLKDLKNEWNLQDNIFPNQEHSIEKWICIIGEEFGELCKSVIEYDDFEAYSEKIQKELVQIFTLCIRVRYSNYGFTQENIGENIFNLKI